MTTTTSTEKTNYALPIAVMFLLFFMISFVTGLQNPFAIIVKDQFEASNFMSQLGNAANFIAYAFMGIPAGIILQKKGYKFTSLTAVLVGFIGVSITFLSGVTESFGVYLTGAFISGFSMCMLNTVVNPMLNTLGGGGNKGNQLIQFGGAINSIGATIAPVLGGYLIGSAVNKTIQDANPALFLAMGIFAFAFIVLLVVKIPEPGLAITKNQPKKTKKDKHSALSFRHFIFGIIAIFIYVGVEVGIPNMANLYMTTDVTGGGLNIATGVAGSIVGAYWLLMLAGRFIGGVIGAKVSSKAMLATASSLGILLIVIAMFMPIEPSINMFGAVVPAKILFIVLCGLCTSIMWGSIFNLAVEGLGKFTEMASGIFMVMVCGGGLLPLLQGALADSLGFLNSYWLIVVGFAALLLYAVVGSKNVNTNIVTTEEKA
ncbi:MAG: MFS transporter [Dysgonamonadaceae bacterium]|nr:MFS transporter [Dysgonamonadaceae bacterium]MDD3309119.1 MFS transporter [Dysgonamonadaceae bacterium]MDD3900668.1 MFS transporter [Dysgonamonadaceae bacterium]MDD4397932.1 MFS transporter [Dysgonamonadaceae bacterium]